MQGRLAWRPGLVVEAQKERIALWARMQQLPGLVS